MANDVMIYRKDPVTNEDVEVGMATVDENGDAWLRINSEDLSDTLQVDDIDGVAIMNAYRYNDMYHPELNTTPEYIFPEEDFMPEGETVEPAPEEVPSVDGEPVE